MARTSSECRLHLALPEARQAVQDAIERGRLQWKVKESSDSYLKIKQRGFITWLMAPVNLEIGFRKESPETTLVVMNAGQTGWNDTAKAMLESRVARFADDVQAAASRYVKQ